MNLNTNNNFFGFYGAIGRREFILNYMYLNIFIWLILTPWGIWFVHTIFNNPDVIFASQQTYLSSIPKPILASIIISNIFNAVISFGLYSRRMADIAGRPQNILIYILSAFIIFCEFSVCIVANSDTLALGMLAFVISIVLMCIKGKYTGSLPKNEVNLFNWGAFWGTWIWGLINKSYKTLWAIPLSFTPAAASFCIVCGIKGNEWAYKNTKADDIEKFHRGQRHQAIFWNILCAILTIIIPILIGCAMIGFVINNPEKIKSYAETTLSTISKYAVNKSFEKYELSAQENKFYINPKVWTEMNQQTQQNIFYNAVNFAVTEKRVSSKSLGENLIKEVRITKIYSSYNGEILAEFEINEQGSGTVIIRQTSELPFE